MDERLIGRIGSARRNLELKAVDPDPGRSIEICEAIGAEYGGVLVQEDTYFSVPRGRLKLRRENDLPAQLIAYERSDDCGQRESRYRIAEVENDVETEAVLVSALGLIAVVKKVRRLFLYEGVRIHLDRVDDLGSFIEFEAVATSAGSDLGHLDALLADLRHSFGIQDADLIGNSYCDLILAAAKT